jgi:anti-sigma factor RsiW
MTTCRETIDLLLDYLDGELPAELRAHLEEHVGGCQPCEDFLTTYRATMGVCKKALKTKMPDDVAAKMNEFLRVHIKKAE